MKKLLSILSNLQTDYHFKLDFQNMDQHTGGKAWNSPVEYPSRESKHDIKSPKVVCSIKYSKGMSRDGNIQGGAHLQNQSYLLSESLNL